MIVLVTKVLCHHQVCVADDLYNKYGDSFVFIQMREPLEWRVQYKQEGFSRPYLVSFNKQPKLVVKLIKNADVLIFGEAPLKLIRHRKKNCLLFKMSENIFKDTQFKIGAYGRIKRWLSYKYLKQLTNNSNSYLLACSGFAYRDYCKFGIFKNRSLKWGYFPQMPHLAIEETKKKFETTGKTELIWVSRMVKYKNPWYSIKLAEYLLSREIKNFHLTIIGNSDDSEYDYFSDMLKYVKDTRLEDFVSLVGKKSADKILGFYLNAHIALFTADKSEGWSVGINEAMSCCCAVVCSNAIGAVPFLVDKSNGLVFEYDKITDFFEKVETLINNMNLAMNMALMGFEKIHNTWNHIVASQNLSQVIDNYLAGNGVIPCECGPCSKATKLDYDWFKEKND